MEDFLEEGCLHCFLKNEELIRRGMEKEIPGRGSARAKAEHSEMLWSPWQFEFSAHGMQVLRDDECKQDCLLFSL